MIRRTKAPPKAHLIRKTQPKKVLKRTVFKKEEKNCHITMVDVYKRYMASTTKYSQVPYYMTKTKAFALHKRLKNKYYWKFQVLITYRNVTRILIQE